MVHIHVHSVHATFTGAPLPQCSFPIRG